MCALPTRLQTNQVLCKSQRDIVWKSNHLKEAILIRMKHAKSALFAHHKATNLLDHLNTQYTTLYSEYIKPKKRAQQTSGVLCKLFRNASLCSTSPYLHSSQRKKQTCQFNHIPFGQIIVISILINLIVIIILPIIVQPSLWL